MEKLSDSFLAIGESYQKLRNFNKAQKWYSKSWNAYRSIGNVEVCIVNSHYKQVIVNLICLRHCTHGGLAADVPVYDHNISSTKFSFWNLFDIALFLDHSDPE